MRLLGLLKCDNPPKSKKWLYYTQSNLCVFISNKRKQMAMTYDNFKNQLNWMDEKGKKEIENLIAQPWTWEDFKNYWNQYQSETNPQQIQDSNSFSNPQQTSQNQQQNQQTQPVQQPEPKIETPTYDPEEKLDTSMFGKTDGKVKVQEGTAQQTWRPDYQLDSDARMNEITNNLNAYRQTNREYFSDRDTYNKMFHYNDRNDQQKALLDSYWKKKEGMDTAQKYTTWDSIVNGMNDAEITNDQLNYIKEYSPEAYRERQQKQQDEVNLRIANLATPADPTANAELFQSISKKLNLDPWQSYQIYDNWTSMCERLGVFSDSEKLSNYQNQLNQNHQKMESIMTRYANNAGGNVSDALAAARMQKALAPYQQVEANLQNSYQILLNGRNSNLALANQSVQVMQAQAQEDQRIFNQRLQGLGFAMQTASYRTPEQQAQLQLTTTAISNEMNLLQQSRQQDLNLYNQYAGAKLQNQLQNELTDLSVSDPKQLRANLNNALTSYYEQYGDIIQRSQAQVVDDIINYANKKGISVAQALTENFIKPLQWKAEYKSRISETYGTNKYQQQYSYTIDENWNIAIKASWYGEIPQDAFATRPLRQEAYKEVYENSNTWVDYIQNLAWAIKDGSYWGQCGAFVNDVLFSWGNSKIFGNNLDEKIKVCNVNKDDWPQIWYAVVMDMWIIASDWKNKWHVGIISQVYPDGSVDVLESNWNSDETIHIRRYSKEDVANKVKWYYKPSNYDIQKETTTSYADSSSQNPYEWVSKVTGTWIEVNAWWWITDLENQYKKEKDWASNDERKSTLTEYWITLPEYNAQKKKYLDYQAKVSLIEDTQKMYNAVEDLLKWNKENSSSWVWSRHSWYIDRATYDAMNSDNGWDSSTNRFFNNETAVWINKYNFLKNSQLLDKYKELKDAGATFGAMQKSEWDLVGSAASKLNWQTTDADFEAVLEEMKDHYSNILADAWVPWFYNTDI